MPLSVALDHLPDKQSAASYTGAGIATSVGALSAQEWAAVIGIILGIATFAYNVYDKRKRREEAIKTEAATRRAEYARAEHFEHARDGETTPHRHQRSGDDDQRNSETPHG